jgi:radical SAM superfamily enzyme YgiQ (UPF0313 family)
MNDRVLFIFPPHRTFDRFVNPAFSERAIHKGGRSFGSILTDMPLGILAMSAYLKKYTEVETRLVDFNVELNRASDFAYGSFREFFRETLAAPEWQAYNPTIIAISTLFTAAYQNMLDLAEVCRELFPQALIVAGGGVPTNMSKEIFAATGAVKALCYGEGEKPLLGLVQAENKQEYLRSAPAWITPDKVVRGVPGEYDFVEDLDEIPFSDYGLLNPQDYGINPALTAYALVEKARNFHVMTSRGCPHHCCFCSSHTVHGRRMRYQSLSRVREDFTRLREEYRAGTLVFQDDQFLGDKRRALEIIELVKELGLSALFQNGLALYALDRTMLEAMQETGVNQIVLSVESGSEHVLREIMHKPLDLSIVARAAGDCRDLGIYTSVNILIGLPGETKQDLEDALTFLRTLEANWFIISVATPLVGSEMYAICVEKGYLQGDHIGCDYKKAVVETEDFTPEYIEEQAYLMNLDLNFVHNSDMRLGNYELALTGLENVLRAKSDHALAHYYAAECYARLGQAELAQAHREQAEAIVAAQPFWQKYFRLFGLPAGNTP